MHTNAIREESWQIKSTCILARKLKHYVSRELKTSNPNLNFKMTDHYNLSMQKMLLNSIGTNQIQFKQLLNSYIFLWDSA